MESKLFLTMKTNWQIKKLGEVCEIVNGGTPKTGVLRYWDGNILWITPKDMGRLRKIYVEETERKISKAGLERSSAKIIPPNSIILSTRAPIGHLAINTKEISTNQGCKGLIPNKNLDTKFLYYFLKDSVELLNSLGSGTTFKELSGTKLKEVEIPFPSAIEQKRIVKILDEVFEGVEKAKENAEKNLKNSRELFESYLQGVFENSKWEKKTLEEVSLQFGRGKSKHRPRNDKKLYGGKYPFIQTGDIRNSGHFIVEYSQSYSEAGLAQSKLWPRGTICITIAANIAETGILNFDACFPDSVIGLVANPKIADTNFVEYLLQSFKAVLQAKGKGSAQANINMATFEHERFPFPSVSEQKTIVKKLDALAEQTKKLEGIYGQKLADIEELKKSVLKKAFAGEL